MCSATAPQPGAGEAFKKTEPAISSTPTAAVSVTPSIPLPSPTIVSGALSKAEMETTTNVASAAPAIATTAPATKERTPMPGSSIRKTISISSKLYKEPEQATQQVAEILPDLQEPFSMTELEPVWNEYANQLQKQGRMTVSAALTKRKPELRENFALVFAVDSAAAEKDLNDQKADLLAFLRKNYRITN